MVARNKSKELAVVISSRLAGIISLESGNMCFRYDPDYRGPNLSVRMRKSDSLVFENDIVRPVVEGFLPDGDSVRAAMAKRIGTSSHDTISLLSEYGKELPGAVQICPVSEVDSVIASTGSYTPVSDSEIGNRLIDVNDDVAPTWHAVSEHWSLGGNQGKFALAKINGQWMSCEGAYPSTHILKPGVSGMPLQALVEFVSMKTASALHIPTADVAYVEFGGVPAIVIERYDRPIHDGKVARLHQEDICQALGYPPNRKYDVSTRQVMQLLQGNADSGSIQRFSDALMFNYLIGGTDAHAKNYSLIHVSSDVVTLAPLYDVASILPYAKAYTGSKWRKMPMDIGGEKRIGALAGSNVDKFAHSFNLDLEQMRQRFKAFADQLPDAIDLVKREQSGVPGIGNVVEPMIACAQANCQAFLANFDKTHARDSFIRPELNLIYGGALLRQSRLR